MYFINVCLCYPKTWYMYIYSLLKTKLKQLHCPYISLQVGSVRAGLPSDVSCKVIRTPAFTRSGNEEPVVVQTHLEASDLVMSVAMWLFAPGSICWVQIHQLGSVRCRRDTSSSLKILLVSLEVLDRWSWRCGRCGCVVIGIRIEDLGHQHTDPSWRWKATTIEVVASCLEATSYLDCLCEVSFIWDLNDITPRALVVLGENRRGVFHFGWAWSRWSVVPRAWSWSDLFAAFGHNWMSNGHRWAVTVGWFTLDGSVDGTKPLWYNIHL